MPVFLPGKKKPPLRVAMAFTKLTGSCQSMAQLLEQGQHALWRLVSLGQHGRSGLLDDLAARQLGGGCGVIGIHDLAA